MAGHACTFVLANGTPCRATPMRDEPYCFWHSPAHEEEAAEARRLGGLRRRREKTVSGAYDFTGLGSVEAIRRILEIAIVDALGLDNSVARARVLIAGAQAATKLLETGELEARIAALESALGPGRPPPEPLDFEEAA
jgi:hypothetical protein